MRPQFPRPVQPNWYDACRSPSESGMAWNYCLAPVSSRTHRPLRLFCIRGI